MAYLVARFDSTKVTALFSFVPENQGLLALRFAIIGMVPMYWSLTERYIYQCVHFIYIIKNNSDTHPKFCSF